MFSKNRPKAGRVYLTELDRDEIIAKLEKEYRRLRRVLAKHERDGYYDFADPHEVHAHGFEVGATYGFNDALRLLRGMR